MSPISLVLNLLLAGLLVVTLMYGWRLSRQLKALKDSHAHFADAVGDLDRAAARAETGLHQLRASTDDAVDLLAGRLGKAQDLARQLETLSARAEAAAEKAQAVRPAARAAADVRSIFDRPRAAAPQPAMRRTSDAEAEAAAEALILRLSESEALTAPPPPRESAAVARARGDVRDREPVRAEARLDSRFDTLFGPRGGVRPEPRREAPVREAAPDMRLDPRDALRPAPRAEARANPRSRALIDDDLFEPAARSSRLRAFDGGRS